MSFHDIVNLSISFSIIVVSIFISIPRYPIVAAVQGFYVPKTHSDGSSWNLKPHFGGT